MFRVELSCLHPMIWMRGEGDVLHDQQKSECHARTCPVLLDLISWGSRYCELCLRGCDGSGIFEGKAVE